MGPWGINFCMNDWISRGGILSLVFSVVANKKFPWELLWWWYVLFDDIDRICPSLSQIYDINKFNHRCLGPVVTCDCYMERMPWVQFYLVTKKEKQIDRCACDYGKGI